MEEKMLEFLNRDLPLYYEEKEIIRDFIKTFFNHFQPKRLSPEADFDPSVYNDSNSVYWKFEHEEYEKIRCDSLNTANK